MTVAGVSILRRIHSLPKESPSLSLDRHQPETRLSQSSLHGRDDANILVNDLLIAMRSRHQTFSSARERTEKMPKRPPKPIRWWVAPSAGRRSSLHRGAGEGLAVGFENLEMMDADGLAVRISPNHLFVAIDLDQFGGVWVFLSARVTGDHHVSIG